MQNPIVFKVIPAPIPIMAHDLGVQLASDDADKQAAIFTHMGKTIEEWGPRHSWPQQCRAIAEAMTDDECNLLGCVLAPLLDHVQAIPMERARRAKEDA